MQMAANIGAGVTELARLSSISIATTFPPSRDRPADLYAAGRPGACIAETMRFNRQGIEYERARNTTKSSRQVRTRFASLVCSYLLQRPFTLGTGARVLALDWRQYPVTNVVAASRERFILSSPRRPAFCFL